MPIRGSTLRAERSKARVTVTALAEKMDLSRQTLWSIEKDESVEPERVGQYRAALDALLQKRELALRDNTETSPDGQAA
jgi:transcriptional regulator with XRE-family HTH domain